MRVNTYAIYIKIHKNKEVWYYCWKEVWYLNTDIITIVQNLTCMYDIKNNFNDTRIEYWILNIVPYGDIMFEV